MNIEKDELFDINYFMTQMTQEEFSEYMNRHYSEDEIPKYKFNIFRDILSDMKKLKKEKMTSSAEVK